MVDIGEDYLNLIKFEKYLFPYGVKEKIFKISENGSTKDICRLNFYLGELFSKAAVDIANKAGIDLVDIDIIGSHGQTICHLPEDKTTLQIGESSVIAERTGITTISDFRYRDMAVGGEGAPLAPLLHYHVFRSMGKNISILNIGGISNITFILSQAKIIGFDTGPGNMLIDGVVRKLINEEYDEGGRIASKGIINESLLDILMGHPFVKKVPPKSSGREDFGDKLLDRIFKENEKLSLNEYDLIATITAYTAKSISYNYRKFILSKYNIDKIIVCGGGRKNKTLLSMLKEYLSPIPVFISEDFSINGDAIEAMTFALLAFYTINGKVNNIPSVTGAKKGVVMGKITPGWRNRSKA